MADQYALLTRRPPRQIISLIGATEHLPVGDRGEVAPRDNRELHGAPTLRPTDRVVGFQAHAGSVRVLLLSGLTFSTNVPLVPIPARKWGTPPAVWAQIWTPVPQ